MKYTEIPPSERLRRYVKCYFIFESETAVEVVDKVFPGGYMEVMFNLGEGIWKSDFDNGFRTTPPVELWGQITKPMGIKTIGKNLMFGIRFFAHSAGYFLNESLSEFNDKIYDLRDVLGSSVRSLHERLLNMSSLNERVENVEAFLVSRLRQSGRKANKIALVGHVVKDIHQNKLPVEALASRYEITPRYLQKLFLQYTGVTPKLYSKIGRFQYSLKLLSKTDALLTDVAYECGYFDQSHFIREFRSFTGFTPSAYSPENFPVSQAFATN